MRFPLLIISILMLSGCAGLADYTIPLENGYRIDRLSAHQIHIYGDESVDDGIAYMHNYQYVPGKVTAIWSNQTFIVAKQLHLVANENGYEEPPEKPKELDYSYWIIEMAANKVEGPMTKAKLESKFDEKIKFTNIDELERE